MPELSIHRTAIRSDLPQIVEIYNSTIPSRMVTADRRLYNALQGCPYAGLILWVEDGP